MNQNDDMKTTFNISIGNLVGSSLPHSVLEQYFDDKMLMDNIKQNKHTKVNSGSV